MGEDLEAVVDGEPFAGKAAFGLDALAGPSSILLVWTGRADFVDSARLALDCVAMAPGDAGRPPRNPKDERGDETAASRMAFWTS